MQSQQEQENYRIQIIQLKEVLKLKDSRKQQIKQVQDQQKRLQKQQGKTSRQINEHLEMIENEKVPKIWIMAMQKMKINPDGGFNVPAVQNITRKISSKSITISTN